MSKFWKEFKEFALKGNVLDLAVAVIIGAAFGKIVTSFVNDIFMPLISILVGQVNFADLAWTINTGIEGAAPIVLKYGNFIQTTIDFLIVALAIFVVIKGFSKFKKKTEDAPAGPTKDQELLTEIRDLLKSQKN